MGNIKTQLKGITTTSTYEEGEMFSLVNLRPKNGALHPVAPRKVVQELSQEYDIVFVHQGSDYKNWIGVKHEGNYSTIYWDILSRDPLTISSHINAHIHSVEQIGNTLSFVADENIYYAWFTDNKYVYLDVLPQVPVINLGSHSQTHAEYYFYNEYGGGNVTPDNFTEATKGLVNKAMHFLVEGGTVNEEQFPGFGLHLFDSCFVRYAFRLYDGTLTKHSPPILCMPHMDILKTKTIDYEFTKGSLTNNSKVDVYGYRIAMHYSLDVLGGHDYSQWKDIIKSVDIFMSAPIGVSSIENMRKDMPTKTPTSNHFNLIKELTPEAIKNVSDTSTFYFVRSLDLGAYASVLKPDILPSKDADFGKMENLIQQEVMSDDNFSNHNYGATTSYTYNNRLHLGGIKTTFFKGFNYSYFRWWNDYNGIPSSSSDHVDYIAVEVDIYTGTALEKVYSFYSDYTSVSKLFSSAFLSYPDTRAQRITIYEVANESWTKVFSSLLQPHKFLNLAYFVNEGLKPIVEWGRSEPLPQIPDISKLVTQFDPNKIKVSELNNPLNFPNINTYQVGNGRILAMASNAMNVSDRNYGQYPLYVFTTQGVWNLNVGIETVYSTQSAPTSTEVPISSIVESTPFGVVFISNRGLMIINGQEAVYISSQLEQPFKKIEQETNAKIEELLHTFNTHTFIEYLRGVYTLAYNAYENELIICNKDFKFNYVLNFYTKSFFQSTESIDLTVKNLFPDLYVVGENKLKYFLETETKRTHISFMLRPLTYGNEVTKWLQNIKIPFTLYNVERMFVGIYASSDKVKFVGKYGKFYEAMSRAVSYDTKTLASNTARYFLFSYAAILDDDSYLDVIDSEVKTKYNNM